MNSPHKTKPWYSRFHLEIKEKKKSYFIKDPIHNEINFDRSRRWLYQLVNTPEMQRLSKILQLSLSYNNFPTATHTRLSHCLGVYQVAANFIDEWIRKGCLQPDKDRVAINVALAAALLHDVGHGPHSHAFEEYMHFSHEAYATQILSSPETRVHQILVNQALKDKIDPLYYVQKVAQIITKQNKAPELNWVQDLISSQIDADRLDYLLRDSHFSGLSYGSRNIHLLIKWSVIVRAEQLDLINYPAQAKYVNKIAFYDKANHLITNFLINRYTMYAELYANIYSVTYELLIGKIIDYFRQNYHQIRQDPQLQTYHFLYDLIQPYLQPETAKQFDYAKFIKLTDQSFDLILESFCEAADPVLASLANLLKGNISLTQHQFLALSLEEYQQLQTSFQILQTQNPEITYTDQLILPQHQQQWRPVIYDKENPILNYNNETSQVVAYDSFLDQTPLDLEKLLTFNPTSKKYTVIVIQKKLWSKIQAINKKEANPLWPNT
ncbi:HD superfamily phosphohydrolase [Mycoplasmoides fastidiosum]|uniref:HD superfamily phosphohydrolase n=1 Tax=Mycoplasmoides fastidiosum TaxID=92758 RepID=A0ABU0LY23_9BACT|nr:HD domain-containing protein [Mycoplasmoides fastidiosum]MDQ0513575.1 HD superfamily phosphohydrolase [Mycoplasmoides fastidiosum]UUD38003.1 HD domain-containing protein [Mycoplasmoides fastidiosum]